MYVFLHGFAIVNLNLKEFMFVAKATVIEKCRRMVIILRKI